MIQKNLKHRRCDTLIYVSGLRPSNIYLIIILQTFLCYAPFCIYKTRCFNYSKGQSPDMFVGKQKKQIKHRRCDMLIYISGLRPSNIYLIIILQTFRCYAPFRIYKTRCFNYSKGQSPDMFVENNKIKIQSTVGATC